MRMKVHKYLKLIGIIDKEIKINSSSDMLNTFKNANCTNRSISKDKMHVKSIKLKFKL